MCWWWEAGPVCTEGARRGLGSTSCAWHHTLTAHPLAPSTHTYGRPFKAWSLFALSQCLAQSRDLLKEYTPFYSISHPLPS